MERCHGHGSTCFHTGKKSWYGRCGACNFEMPETGVHAGTGLCPVCFAASMPCPCRCPLSLIALQAAEASIADQRQRSGPPPQPLPAALASTAPGLMPVGLVPGQAVEAGSAPGGFAPLPALGYAPFQAATAPGGFAPCQVAPGGAMAIQAATMVAGGGGFAPGIAPSRPCGGFQPAPPVPPVPAVGAGFAAEPDEGTVPSTYLLPRAGASASQDPGAASSQPAASSQAQLEASSQAPPSDIAALSLRMDTRLNRLEAKLDRLADEVRALALNMELLQLDRSPGR